MSRVLFLQAGRYHWLLQLLLDEMGGRLAWIGPGKLAFKFQTSSAELDHLRGALLGAATQMRANGWWADPAEVKLRTDGQIRLQLAREVWFT